MRDRMTDSGRIAAGEFTDIYIAGPWLRRAPQSEDIAGTTHNVFGIQTGVAIGFFVRDKSTDGKVWNTLRSPRRR